MLYELTDQQVAIIKAWMAVSDALDGPVDPVILRAKSSGPDIVQALSEPVTLEGQPEGTANWHPELRKTHEAGQHMGWADHESSVGGW